MPAATLPLFLGNYADSIHAADFDTVAGTLSADRAAAPVAKASFLARSTDGRFLYAVSEGNSGMVYAFAIDASHNLSPLNSRPSEGAGPCDVSLSPDGRLIAVANYTGGSVTVFRVETDGQLGEKVAHFEHRHAAEAVTDRQTQAHAHGVTWAPNGRLLLVPDLGGDRVYLYACDPASGALAPNPAQPWLELPRGSGPRHAHLSPDGRHLYIVNELGNTVSVAAYNEKSSMLTLVETVSTLPASGFAGPTKTAEIAIHPAGHTVYASNRGLDTLAVFTRDPESGRLTLRAQVAVPPNPRHFTLSPDARWMLVAGQSANKVAIFAVEPSTGNLAPTETSFVSPKPVCLRF